MDACAKVYVKNVRLNVSNSELLLLRKKEEKRNSLSGFPTFSMTFFKVLQSFHPLRLSFQKFGQKKTFFDEFSSDVQQMLFTFNDIN